MSNKTLIIIAIVLLAVGGLLYYGGYLGNTTSGPVPSPQVTSVPTAANKTQVKTFNVDAVPFSFTPNEIRVKQGDTVEIQFNVKEGFHDFVIDEFNVRAKQMQAGGSETIRFVADKKGTFEYYCSVGNHRQMGMVGKLIVE